jgi:hypothetical protein
MNDFSSDLFNDYDAFDLAEHDNHKKSVDIQGLMQ